MSRIKKTDGNHLKLMEQIRQIPGASVVSIHTIGKGVPDLLLGFCKRTYLLEVKNPKLSPSKRKLTPDEEKFHQLWTGSVHVVETIQDVLNILKKAV
jgi:hypothetical protein